MQSRDSFLRIAMQFSTRCYPLYAYTLIHNIHDIVSFYLL